MYYQFTLKELSVKESNGIKKKETKKNKKNKKMEFLQVTSLVFIYRTRLDDSFTKINDKRSVTITNGGSNGNTKKDTASRHRLHCIVLDSQLLSLSQSESIHHRDLIVNTQKKINL